MITKEEVEGLLRSTETFRVEKTISTGNMDKFCEAICAFSNDLPNSRQKGYLLIGVNDDGSRCGLHVDAADIGTVCAGCVDDRASCVGESVPREDSD